MFTRSNSRSSLQTLIVVLLNQIGFTAIKVWLSLMSLLSVGYTSKVLLKYELKGPAGDLRWDYENMQLTSTSAFEDPVPRYEPLATTTDSTHRKRIKPDLRLVLECKNCGWCSYRTTNHETYY